MENEEKETINEQPTPQMEEQPTPEAEQSPSLEEPKDDLQTLITQVRADYEAKIEKQREEYENRIAERDKVIKGLLNSENEPAPRSIAETINQQREKQLKY